MKFSYGLACAAFGILALGVSPTSIVPSAHAQQGLQGGGQGAGSGGTTVNGSAGPRGSGAGGTQAGGTSGNTSGNGNAGSAATGRSVGPGTVNQNRYGGRIAVTPPPPPATPPGLPPISDDTIADILSKLRTGAEGSEAVPFSSPCAVAARHPTMDQRLSGSNVNQLAAAQYLLAPNFDPGGATTALVLLANYQEEMEAQRPDTLLAASYLALTATRPVTSELVAQVNALLCITTTRNLAAEIAAQAETHRQAGRGSAGG